LNKPPFFQYYFLCWPVPQAKAIPWTAEFCALSLGLIFEAPAWHESWFIILQCSLNNKNDLPALLVIRNSVLE
jgi:hypothetical protein